MKPPVEPTKDDCCKSGCNPCIFDVYEKQLKLYENYIKRVDKSYKTIDYGISPLKYTKFCLIDVVQISNNQKILYFQKSNYDEYKQIRWKPGDHFLLKYTSSNVSCTRAYTPVKLKMHGDAVKYDFLIAVRKYSNGLVSNYLFNLTIGKETLWRGPYGSYNIETNKYDKIIMLAQGTGIAPFISIIQNILDNEDDMTRIIVLYCCKDIIEILFRDELYEFNSYWNFLYKVFLNNDECNNLVKKYNEPVIYQKFNGTELDKLKPHVNDQYLICGSKQFTEEYEAFLKNGNYSDNIFLF